MVIWAAGPIMYIPYNVILAKILVHNRITLERFFETENMLLTNSWDMILANVMFQKNHYQVT